MVLGCNELLNAFSSAASSIPYSPARAHVYCLLLQILVALFLFDTDADGKLTFAEVTMYIASVLRVMHAVSEGVSGDCPLDKAP